MINTINDEKTSENVRAKNEPLFKKRDIVTHSYYY